MTEHGQTGYRSHAPDKVKTGCAKLKISTYNVRTLNDTAVGSELVIKHKLNQLIAGCESYNIDILCIQEHRLTTNKENGENFRLEKYSEWTLAHSGSDHHCHGVAVLFNKKIAASITSIVWKSDRILAIHLQGNPKMCIICVYAPTETSPTAMKQQFYAELLETVLAIPPHSVLIIAGDLNAHVGQDSHETNRSVVGPNCFHGSTNNNGERLVEMCEAARLRLAHSHFENKKSRLVSWKSPKGDYAQLDHIIINQKWWKSIKNCRSHNTMCIGSDHKVVTATFRLSLRGSKLKSIARSKYNTDQLLDKDKRHVFNLELSNKYASLYDETLNLSPTEEIQRHANVLNEALVETCETVLGKRTNSKQPSWVSSNTLLLIERKDQAKKDHRQQPTKECCIKT
jgi:exonuclease III